MASALVIEDDPAIRALIRYTLEGRGYDVRDAEDGLSGLAAARAETPDVISLDIGLPDIDGLAVLLRLKEDVLLRRVPVVMVTAWAEPDMIRLATDRGAADYVAKPFDVADLGARIDAVLETPAPGPVADATAAVQDRSRLDGILTQQATAARRTGRPFAVVAVGLPDLAAVRAERGRDVADDLGRALAKRLRQHTAVCDALFRWDDDTVAVVLPNTDAAGAAERAETVRAAVAAHPLDTPTGAFALPAAVGVAAFDAAEHHTRTLDRALAACRAPAAHLPAPPP